MKKIKVSRNHQCPCGKQGKYKNCCLGKKDWEKILNSGDLNLFAKNLSLRGKNQYFFNSLLNIIQIEPKDLYNNRKFKDSITPKVVREIHEKIIEIWPDKSDLNRIYKENRDEKTALYTGWYEPTEIIRSITRSSLYTEKIFIVDPFLEPRDMREEFNPIAHPEKHIVNTIKDVRIWLTLNPWVDAGIVSFIRNPCDFNYPMMMECIENAEKRNKENPELKKYISDIPKIIDDEMKQYYSLLRPDNIIIDEIEKMDTKYTREEILIQINKMRDKHPFFVSLEHSKHGNSSLLAYKMGANFDMAKIIASATNSHIITDSMYRWKEIELEQKSLNINQGYWSSFSKALQNTSMKCLEKIDIQNAIAIRENKYLERLRLFFSDVWRKSFEGDLFDEKNAFYLEQELKQRINEAEIEWNEIENKFLKRFVTGAAATAVSYTTIASFNAEMLAGSLLITGLTSLAKGWLDENNFVKKFPASFFMKIKE